MVLCNWNPTKKSIITQGLCIPEEHQDSRSNSVTYNTSNVDEGSLSTSKSNEHQRQQVIYNDTIFQGWVNANNLQV